MSKSKIEDRTSEGEQRNMMKQLLADEKNKIKIPQEGDLIEGTIIDIGKQAIYLDLGPIGTGVIFGRELQDGLGTLKNLKPGDKIKATVIDLENDDGYVELSIRTASYELAWEDIYKKVQTGEIISAKIREANRGGLIAEIYGIKAFLPVSQLAAQHYPRVEEGDKSQILALLNKLINKDLKVKIIDANKEEEKLILSEKETYAAEERQAISSLKIGDTIEGVISGVVDFGAFVKFNSASEGGKEMEGLVHISELAWQLIENPRDIIKVNDKVKAKIIGIDGTRISLSVKALKEDPWSILKYKIGDIVSGTVHKITPYGAFVYLDRDIHGLIHISELGSIEEARKRLAVGKTDKFKIISLGAKEHRMGLSLAEKGAGAKSANERIDAEHGKKSALSGSADEAEKTPKAETVKHELKIETAKQEAKEEPVKPKEKTKPETKKTEIKKSAKGESASDGEKKEAKEKKTKKPATKKTTKKKYCIS